MSDHPKFSSITTKLLYLTVSLIGAIPVGIRRAIGSALGWIAAALPLRDRELATLQIKTFLKSPSPEKTTRRVFQHFAILLLEAMNLKPFTQNPERYIICPDNELIERITKSDSPILALSAHTGNWELLAAYMASRGIPVVTIGREIRLKPIQEFLKWYRSNNGVKTLWRGGTDGKRDLLKFFKSGGTLAALIDQDTRVSAIQSTFFGYPAATPSSLIELGKKHNAHFVTAFNFRTEEGRFLIRIEEIPTNLTSQEIVDLYNERLEQYIRQYPSQWVWFHKRWRRDQADRRLSSEEYTAYLESCS